MSDNHPVIQGLTTKDSSSKMTTYRQHLVWAVWDKSRRDWPGSAGKGTTPVKGFFLSN